MYERVLIAIDGSEQSSKAAEAAVDLAAKEGAALFVIMVVPSPVYAGRGQGAQAQAPEDVARVNAEKLVASVVSKAEDRGVKARGEIVENIHSVVKAIADYADEWKVELVVVGTRGLGMMKKMVLGSVSAGLLSEAKCDLLIVR
ncbi:MAG: universal stress protein [Thaumarchaeota archaeon]|nr:universal stress protein [Nitrososphaerota archaeon]